MCNAEKTIVKMGKYNPYMRAATMFNLCQSSCQLDSSRWRKMRKDVAAGLGLKAVPRFGELCCCYCLALLPRLSCSIHATWGPPFSQALYCPLSV